jgi:hypothetical protein
VRGGHGTFFCRVLEPELVQMEEEEAEDECGEISEIEGGGGVLVYRPVFEFVGQFFWVMTQLFWFSFFQNFPKSEFFAW